MKIDKAENCEKPKKHLKISFEYKVFETTVKKTFNKLVDFDQDCRQLSETSEALH